MSYLEMATIYTADPQFKGRCRMCIAEQAKIFYNDDRPEFFELAKIAMTDVDVVLQQMYPFICSEPGMGSQASDGQILSAVQMLWSIIGDKYRPIVTTPPPATP
jgi:hypothetical protein